MHIDRSVFRYVEHELYNYDSTKRYIEDLRDSIIHQTIPRETIPGTGHVSDPTARKAIKLVSSPVLAHMERVVNAVDKALKRLSDDHVSLFELKYRQGLSWRRVCAEMPTSERTYFRLRRELVLMVACELGLVDVWEVAN